MNKLGPALLEYDDPPVKALFVYNCNPVATMPDSSACSKGMARDDLFTVVFDQVMTDTAAFADVILPATTFLEAYDFAGATARSACSSCGRSSMPSANRDRTPKCSASWPAGSSCSTGAEPDNELDMLLQHLQDAAGNRRRADGRDRTRRRRRSEVRPIQFVDVMPRTRRSED